VNLDAVQVLVPQQDRTDIHIGGWTHPVDMPIEDVLALVSPPAAPDTYEEELRDRLTAIRSKVADLPPAAPAPKKRASEGLNWAPRSYSNTERTARLNELQRVQESVNKALYGALDGAGLEKRFNAIIEARRAALEA
jgi:hypothetical protein